MKNGGCTLPPKRSPSITPSARGICAGSSGIARFATALGDKNAGCHAPPAVLVRGGSTCQGVGGPPLRVRVAPRSHAVAPRKCRACRAVPLPFDTYIIPHNTEKVNTFFKKFFDRFRRCTSKFLAQEKGRKSPFSSHKNLASCPKCTFVSSKISPVRALASTK